MIVQQPIRPAKRPNAWRRAGTSAHPASWVPHAALMLLIVASIVALNPQFAAAQGDRVGEYELKAAILYNLTKFVEWPDSAYPDRQAPTVMCILGRDPFGSSLNAEIPKEAANGRPLVIRYSQRQESARDCHILYISSSERRTMGQVFSTLKGSSVLTVGETSEFAAQGGMVQFTLQDKQVQFEINLDAASREGLKISSRLLVLARIVTDQNHKSDGQKDPISSNSALKTMSKKGRLLLTKTRGWHAGAQKT